MDRPLQEGLLRIGECTLDSVRSILLRRGEVVPIRAKAFGLLTYLAKNRGRVLSKDELLAAIWPNVIVSEDSLTQCVRDLRRALGNEDQKWLRTVARRGYMLAFDDLAEPASMPEQTFPAIAILPFGNRGNDPSDNALIDGIVEEITYGMARFRSIVVIARSSAFAFPPADRPPLHEIGERLNAEFIVEGSVARANGRLRIAVTLSQAATGQQIWGNHFDFAEADLLAMHDKIAGMIISRLVSNIDLAVQQSTRPGMTSLAAFENFARGLALLRAYGSDVNERARSHFLKAVEIDPEFAVAIAYAALADVIIAGYAGAPRPVLEKARDRINMALAIEPEEARCHRIMGLVRLYLREHEAAERFLRLAYDLNPYDADALAQLGFVIAIRGRSGEGLAWIERAIALNPFRPHWYDEGKSYALFGLGRYGELIDIFLGAPEMDAYRYMWLTAANAMSGNLAKATDALAKMRERMGDADPLEFARTETEYEREDDFQKLIEGLRIAARASIQAQGS